MNLVRTEGLISVTHNLIEFEKELYAEHPKNNEAKIILEYICAFLYGNIISSEFDFELEDHHIVPMKQRLLKKIPKYKNWSHLMFHGESLTFMELYYYHRAMDMIINDDMSFSEKDPFSPVEIKSIENNNDVSSHTTIRFVISEKIICYFYNMHDVCNASSNWVGGGCPSTLKEVIKIKYLLNKCWNLKEIPVAEALFIDEIEDKICTILSSGFSVKEIQKHMGDDKELLCFMKAFKVLLTEMGYIFLDKMPKSFREFIEYFMYPFGSIDPDVNALVDRLYPKRITSHDKNCARCLMLHEHRKYWKSIHFLVFCYMGNKTETMKQVYDVFVDLIDQYKHQGEELEKIFDFKNRK